MMIGEKAVQLTEGCNSYMSGGACGGEFASGFSSFIFNSMFIVVALMVLLIIAELIAQTIRIFERKVLQRNFLFIEFWFALALAPMLTHITLGALWKILAQFTQTSNPFRIPMLDLLLASTNPLYVYSFWWYSITVVIVGMVVVLDYKTMFWHLLTGKLDLARQEAEKISKLIAKQEQEAREREKASKLAKETKYLSSLESEMTAWNRTPEAEDIQHQSEEARILSEEELLLAFDQTKAKLELDKNS